MNRIEHLWGILMEESGEVTQAASKCNRFTPEHSYYETSNLERLKVELDDQYTLLKMIGDEIGTTFSPKYDAAKAARVEKLLEVSRELGTLS